MRLPLVITLGAMAALAWLASSRADPQPTVAYPQGFTRWTHVTTGLIGPGNPAYAHFGGFHDVYANARAVEGYGAGRFEDGAVVVFDVHEAKTVQDAASPGARRLIDVMVKDRTRFASTGGWGFAEFPADARAPQGLQPANACYSCHAVREKQDHVFSRLAD